MAAPAHESLFNGVPSCLALAMPALHSTRLSHQQQQRHAKKRGIAGMCECAPTRGQHTLCGVCDACHPMPCHAAAAKDPHTHPCRYPDARHGTVDGTPIPELLGDEWVDGAFVAAVQQRGTAILRARGLSSALSAASAVCDHVRDWVLGTPRGQWVSMVGGGWGAELARLWLWCGCVLALQCTSLRVPGSGPPGEVWSGCPTFHLLSSRRWLPLKTNIWPKQAVQTELTRPLTSCPNAPLWLEGCRV